MPTVPTYDSPQVNPEALPNIRVQPAATEETFGGGQSQKEVTQAAVGLQDAAKDIFDTEKKKADDVQTLNAYGKAVSLVNELRYNTKDGLMTKKGQDAFGAIDEFGQRYKEGVKDIQNGLTNDAQRLRFAHLERHLNSQFQLELHRHVSQEAQRFEADSTNATVETLQNDAALNYFRTGKVAENQGLQEGIIRNYAENNGWSEEQTSLKVGESKSATNLAVVQRMLDNGDKKSADNYFSEVRGDQMSIKDVHSAISAFHAYDAEQQRQQRTSDDAKAAQIERVQNDFVLRLMDNKLTANDIKNSPLPPFGQGSKEQFWKLIQSEGKKTDPQTWNDVFSRVHLPDGDPRKINRSDELYPYVIDEKMSKEDLNWFRTEIQGGNTEDGRQRNVMMKGLEDVAKQALVKTNPMLGIQDPQGEFNFVRFNKFVADRVNERVKNKQPIDTLFDPNSKDWLGNSLGSFTRTPQDIIKSMTQFTPGGTAPTQATPPGTVPTGAQSAPPPAAPLGTPAPATQPKTSGASPPLVVPTSKRSARLPGESPADYIRRLKGAK